MVIVAAVLLVSILCVMQVYFYLQTRTAALRLHDLFPVTSPPAIVVRPEKMPEPAGTTEGQEEPTAPSNKALRAAHLLAVGSVSDGFAKILEGINGYLERTRGMPVTFLVLQDIAERTADSYAQSASASVTLPLYLGLMGTFAGAILGLGSMTFGPSTAVNDAGLNQFLSGVLVAMLGSLVGLLLYVAGRRHLARAQGAVNFRKRDFFILLQGELLPAAGEDVSTALYSLQANLSRFNEDLSRNLASFSTAMEAPGVTLQQQRELLEVLQKTDLKRLMEANGTMLTAVTTAAPVLSKFLDATQGFVQDLRSVNDLTGRAAALMDRFLAFETSINGLASQLKADDQIVRLVQSQLDTLESRKEMVQQYLAVQDDTIQRSLRAQTVEVDKLFTASQQELANISQQLARTLLNVATADRAEELLGDVRLLREHSTLLRDQGALSREQGTLLREQRALLGEIAQRSAASQQVLSTLAERQGRNTRGDALLEEILLLLRQQAARRTFMDRVLGRGKEVKPYAGQQ